MRIPRPAAIPAVLLLMSSPAAAQPARERALLERLAAEPRELRHYFRLADHYAEENRTNDADRVLRDALAEIDPVSREIYERRILLFLDPFLPRRIGAVADEWLGVDGTNAVATLLAAGHRMRLASAARGNGTAEAEQEIALGLRIVDGALPSHPDLPALHFVRSNLLQAGAALAADPARQTALIEEARDAYRQGERHQKGAEGNPSIGGVLSGIVAGMIRMPPFGPRGAVRAGALVPVPRLIKDGGQHLVRARPADPRRFRSVPLELVVGPDGRVAGVYAPQSLDGYDRALAQLVQDREYEPTMVDGRPVSVIVLVSVPAP